MRDILASPAQAIETAEHIRAKQCDAGKVLRPCRVVPLTSTSFDSMSAGTSASVQALCMRQSMASQVVLKGFYRKKVCLTLLLLPHKSFKWQNASTSYLPSRWDARHVLRPYSAVATAPFASTRFDVKPMEASPSVIRALHMQRSMGSQVVLQASRKRTFD